MNATFSCSPQQLIYLCFVGCHGMVSILPQGMRFVANHHKPATTTPHSNSSNSNGNNSDSNDQYSKLSKLHRPTPPRSLCALMKINRNWILGLVALLGLHYMTQNYLHFRLHAKRAGASDVETAGVPVAVEQLIKSYEASLSLNPVPASSGEPLSNTNPESVEDALVTFIIPTMFRPSLVATLMSLLNQSSGSWEAIVVYQTPLLFEPSATRNRLLPKPLDHFHILPKYLLDHPRIQFLESSATAEVNFAGNMRNDALLHIRRKANSWIAFVDDDDTLLPHYVQSLFEEAVLTPSADVVLFRMLCVNCYTLVIPPVSHLNLLRSYSGISFAVKNHLLTPPHTSHNHHNNSNANSNNNDNDNNDQQLSHNEADEVEELFPFSRHPLFSFPSGANEDFCLLYNIRNGGHTIVLSPSITYLVKGLQEIYIPELESSDGGRHTNITRSVITALPGTYPAECLQKQLPKDTLPSSDSNSGSDHGMSDTHLGFSFPETGHYIFQQNIAGLKQALSQANRAGCMLPWLLETLHIDIHFSYLTPVTKGRPYIQVQMEQIHSRRNMFTDNYVKKLKGALQVWAIAPSHYTFLQQYLQIPQTFFVPLWHMIDPAVSAEHTCRNQSLIPKQAIVQRVQAGVPFFSDTKDSLLEECIILPRFPRSGDEALVRNQVSKQDKKNKAKKRIRSPSESPSSGSYTKTPMCGLPKVVMYGALSGSDNDRRLKLCIALKEALSTASASSSGVSTFECFHGIYGPSLDNVLCTADIIVVDRFYGNGAIESHRIDPLLKMGKAVVSMGSKDRNLQALYGDAVIFARDVEEMVARVMELLADARMRERQQQRGIEFVTLKAAQSQPLCHAFAALQQKLIAHSKITPSLVHIETPKEKKQRLKRKRKEKKEGGKKLKPIPPSPPMPDEVRAAAAKANKRKRGQS